MQLSGSTVDCGVMFFSASAESMRENRYGVVIETAKYADRHGFSSIWVPERHFTLLGGLYPNPSVLQAALAMVTERIRLHAGSVVLPLHNPLRVAEEWAMVDNLSRGRVGISFASGWHPADFTFFPERYAERQDALFAAIPLVHKLWSGESLTVKSGSGDDVNVSIFPRPIQRELPTWVTAAGNPQTYERVGALGANLLTHLLDQGVEALAQKIDIYRRARAAHGHDSQGRVSIMIHTFLGADANVAREKARQPFCEFLKLNAGLLNGLAKARGRDMDFRQLSPKDQDEFVQFIYERFIQSRAFIGSPESCVEVAADLYRAGVDELLFLLDFGPSYEEIIQGLPYLTQLKELCSSASFAERASRPVEAASQTLILSEKRAAAAEAGLAGARARCLERMDGSQFYERLREAGVQVDASLQAVEELRFGDAEVLGHVTIPEVSDEARGRALVLEGCTQVALGTTLGSRVTKETGLFLPWTLDALEWEKAPSGDLWVYAQRRVAASGHRVVVDVRIYTPQSERIASLRVELAELGAERDVARATVDEPSLLGAGRYLHEVEWRPLERKDVVREPVSWLILCDEQGVGESLAETLRLRGDSCTLAKYSPDGIENESAGMARLINSVTALSGSRPLRGIVHLWSLDATPSDATSVVSLEADATRCLGSALAAMKAVTESDASGLKCRLWLVTRGSQAVDASAPTRISQAPLWGLGQAFSVEHRQFFGGLVDLDPESSSLQAGSDLADALEIAAERAEDLIGIRAGALRAPRLLRKEQRLATSLSLRDDASYLVTGGLGGIGLVTAEWLVKQGARHVILVGRNVPPERSSWDALTDLGRWTKAVTVLRGLEEDGAHVTCAAVDVGDADSWRTFLADHDEAGRPPIRGVFHTAGTLVPHRLLELDLQKIQEAFRSKVAGTWQAHQSFAERDLDFFVTFSSAPPHLGVLGQSLGAYCAANAFMDALAAFRQSRGLPAVNIKWGPWSEVGLHTAETSASSNLERLASFGLSGISNQEGMEILGHLLSQRQNQCWVVAADWARLFQNDFLIASKPFFAELAFTAGESAGETADALARREAFLAKLAPLASKAQKQKLVAHIRELVSAVMRLDAASVDWRRGLFDMGMDSLMALELKTKLQNDVGISISATLAFDYPTVDAIAGYLQAQLFGAEEGDAGATGDAVVTMSETELDALDEGELEAALLAKLEAI